MLNVNIWWPHAVSWFFLVISRWRHQMESFSALLALCEGNPSVTGGFLSQRPVMQSFDVFFDLRMNKRLNKQPRPRHWWFETPPRSLWRHCNANGVTNLNGVLESFVVIRITYVLVCFGLYILYGSSISPLELRHMSVSNYGRLNCLLRSLFRLTKLRIIVSPCEFSSWRASIGRIKLPVSTASHTYELSEETHVTPFRTYILHLTGLCNWVTNPKNGQTLEQLAVGTDSRSVSTGPIRMFSVLAECRHVGYSRGFVGTIYCTYGQSNMTNARRIFMPYVIMP